MGRVPGQRDATAPPRRGDGRAERVDGTTDDLAITGAQPTGQQGPDAGVAADLLPVVGVEQHELPAGVAAVAAGGVVRPGRVAPLAGAGYTRVHPIGQPYVDDQPVSVEAEVGEGSPGAL